MVNKKVQIKLGIKLYMDMINNKSNSGLRFNSFISKLDYRTRDKLIQQLNEL